MTVAVTLYRKIDALGGTVDPSDLRAVGRMEMLDTVLAILTRRGFSEHVEAVALTREVLADRLHAELGDAYDCTRVWSAWSYGTMTEDDFTPVSERIDEIVEGILSPVQRVSA